MARHPISARLASRPPSVTLRHSSCAQIELTVRHSASRGVVSQRDLTKVVERFNSGAGTSTLDLLIPMDLKFREAVGFSVGGGQYQPVVPGDTAIYVGYISPDSAMGRSGQLQIGDRVDEINGECVAKVSHTAFKYAFKANPKELAMKVTRVEGAVSDAQRRFFPLFFPPSRE